MDTLLSRNGFFNDWVQVESKDANIFVLCTPKCKMRFCRKPCNVARVGVIPCAVSRVCRGKWAKGFRPPLAQPADAPEKATIVEDDGSYEEI